MNEDESQKSPLDWEAYWQGTSDAASFNSGGVSHHQLTAFWREIFHDYKSSSSEIISIVDVASGNGAVVDIALQTIGSDNIEVTCVDNAQSALKALSERFPMVNTCLADAKDIPLTRGSFDLATSQYGVEYAGKESILEMASLVKPGGKLAMIIHHSEGGIFQECEDAASAVTRMQSADFIPLAKNLLVARFAVAKGGNPANYQSAKKQMAPAVLEMKKIMLELGENVAGETIKRLYDDVANINRRIANFDQAEIDSWLSQMHSEMDAYTGRMRSMCDAALSTKEFSDVCDDLNNIGFSITRRNNLTPKDADLALGWALVAIRT